jgi:hypothetical protein
MKKRYLQIKCACGKSIEQKHNGAIRTLCDECRLKHRQANIKKSNAQHPNRHKKKATGVMAELCPDCGNPLIYCVGILECSSCGYSHVFAPCVCCIIPFKECPTMARCHEYLEWKKHYGNQKK